MANELTLSGLRIQFTKANVPSVDFQSPPISITVTANANMDNVQDVGFAAEEAILLGDVASGGYWYIENLDTTNYVSLRAAIAETVFMKLAAGKWAILPVIAAAPTIQANTAAVKVRLFRFGL